MFLKRISIVNFKNYKQLEAELSPKINCFVGNNGVGKTNLLDAVYYLSMTKSYFNVSDAQNVNHGEDFFLVQGDFNRKDEEVHIHCGFQKGKKKTMKRNKKDYDRLSHHIGYLPVVIVSPIDSSLIVAGGEERRRYLDGVISQSDKDYLEALLSYNRVLLQRNKLLKDFAVRGNFDASFLEVYNQQLVQYGNVVHEKRADFISKLIPVFQNYYSKISGDNEKVGLTYKSQLNDADFSALLSEAQEKDRIVQYTSVGIHRDDIVLKLDAYPMKRIGSQGQQKTFLIALKLAQFEFIKEVSEIPPILLLDDVFDKLDAERVEQIVQLVSENTFGQIFFTDTNQGRMENILKKIHIDYRIFEVEQNELKKLQ